MCGCFRSELKGGIKVIEVIRVHTPNDLNDFNNPDVEIFRITSA